LFFVEKLDTKSKKSKKKRGALIGLTQGRFQLQERKKGGLALF